MESTVKYRAGEGWGISSNLTLGFETDATLWIHGVQILPCTCWNGPQSTITSDGVEPARIPLRRASVAKDILFLFVLSGGGEMGTCCCGTQRGMGEL
jgi:hypothetical protein